jgi:hypothetical protein
VQKCPFAAYLLGHFLDVFVLPELAVRITVGVLVELQKMVIQRRRKPMSKLSRAEQDTGVLWIDGKHVYQKTILLGSLRVAQHVHGVVNIDTMVNLHGAATDKRGNYIRLPHVDAQAIGNQIGLSVGPQFINVSTGADYSTYWGHVTMRYTCTDR